MIFKTLHRTIYSFSSKIFLEPHYLRFKPRNSPHTRLINFNITLEPSPAGISEQFDMEGNLVHHCWFENLTDRLEVVAASTLETQEFNPFNFLLEKVEHNQLPITYSKSTGRYLKPYLETSTISEAMVDYVQKIMSSCDNDTLRFITQLTKEIHQDLTLEYRADGDPHEPAYTLEHKRGSCRDLTWLQIQLLRRIGLAARFVSGYYYIPSEHPLYELHAWLEVYLPGAGWIGFDPSHGIAAGDYHLAVSASSHYLNTMPVTGSTRGETVSSLETQLTIEAVDGP